jgi:peptidoglycan/xylan/chitin deacetylase (PgdA/CDA1 family)
MNSAFFAIPIPFPVSFLRKKAGINPLIINYHVVSDCRIPHISNIYSYRNTRRFREDLSFYSHNYHLISLPELLESIKNNTPLPDNSLLITFDDGFREVYEIAMPILVEKKIFPAIFITKNYVDNVELGYDHRKSLLIERLLNSKSIQNKRIVGKILGTNSLQDKNLIHLMVNIPYKNKELVDRIAGELEVDFREYVSEKKPYLSSQQVRDLIKTGFSFGGHSVDHPNFIELSLDEQLQQAQESIDFVCDTFNINYKVFAFPYWDAGVSREFFEKLCADATFGTQGLLADPVRTNFQRIGIERYNYSSNRIVKAHYVRKMIYRSLDKDTITRS